MAGGPKCVNLFYDDWVFRPDDLRCQPAYKQALIELEASGDIEVLDKDGVTPKPASKRRKSTLGEGYFVKLSKAP